MAWDWINKKLYFTDKDRQTVEVLDPETGYSKVLIDFNDNFILPRRVIVDPLSRYYTYMWTAIAGGKCILSGFYHKGRPSRTPTVEVGSHIIVPL